MRGYRDGKKVVYCDGCFGVIENFKTRIHLLTTQKRKPVHAHRAPGGSCVKKARKHSMTLETSCSTAGCGMRVATGEPACLNKHPQ